MVKDNPIIYCFFIQLMCVFVMILYIAEKPSLGRAIADALPKPHKKEDGCIRASNGDVVSWCFGHLLELAEPEQYDPAFKKWDLQHLPIIPDNWKMQPKTKTRKQIALLRKLTKEADQIVHAGDPDREGQLLVDEVIDYLKIPNYKRDTIKRCLISDLNLVAVKRALTQLRDNKEFVPLAVSALARSRADWLYGINLTRAYTLQGQRAGYNGVLSVGRVQTPILGLVVRRDLEIESFQSKPFYEVIAHLKTESGEAFTAKWQPSEACLKWQDEEGRILSKALASNVAARIEEQEGHVKSVSQKPKRSSPPLPYNLSSLQIDANKRYGLSAQQVLDTCQALYEKHKLLTYPRSDCRYLPEGHLAEVKSIADVIHGHCSAFEPFKNQLDYSRKSKAWNDKKVDAHHAIIPTSRRTELSRLTKAEQQVYELVARQYLAQFMLDHLYSETKVDVEVAGGDFRASAKQITQPGWKLLYQKTGADGTDKELLLPPLEKGQLLACIKGEVLEKITQPPKPYTDATLLAAMTGIARYVDDPEIKKILKETDGLGTEATRAGILELLFKRQFLVRKSKSIHSTQTGRALICSLPDKASKPDMTAQWESSLDAISQQLLSYQSFMQPLNTVLNEMITQAKGLDTSLLKALPQTKPARFKRKGKSRTYKAKSKA